MLLSHHPCLARLEFKCHIRSALMHQVETKVLYEKHFLRLSFETGFRARNELHLEGPPRLSLAALRALLLPQGSLGEPHA